MRAPWLMLLSVALGCYKPSATPCAISCTTAADCAAFSELGAGAVCDQQRCTVAGGTCGPVDAAIPDAPPAQPLGTVVQLAAGNGFACARDDKNEVVCWGANVSHAVRVAGADAEPRPIQRPGTWAALSVGGGHACGIDPGGHLSCWGANAHGESGAAPSASVDATAIAGTWSAVAAGFDHTCAVGSGALSCWGANDVGQLGRGAIGSADPTPVAVASPTNQPWSNVWAGDGVTCGASGSGFYCWGENSTRRANPGVSLTAVLGPKTVTLPTNGVPTDVAIGHDAVCAIVTGSLICWGDNQRGAVGANGTTGVVAPAVVQSNVIAVTAGFASMCSLGSGHVVSCWGDEVAGGLADGAWQNRQSAPHAVQPPNVSLIALGDRRAIRATDDDDQELGCALIGSAVSCWGHNAYGQLGDGHVARAARPVLVSGGAGARYLVTGRHHACAEGSGSDVECWGTTEAGQASPNPTGTPTTPCALGPLACDVDVPTAIDGTPTGSGDRELAAGYDHTCALSNASATCWGADDRLQLGVAGSTKHMTTSPTAVKGVAATANQTCLLSQLAQAPTCWGDILITRNGGPQAVPEYALFQQFAFTTTTGALLHGANVISWTGSNDRGQFGDGTLVGTGSAQLKAGSGTYSAVAVSEAGFGCGVVASSGRVVCWGDNTTGGVVKSGAMLSTSPVDTTLTGCSTVTAGADHACALCGSAVTCWGGNRDGQAGAAPSATVALTNVSPAQGGGWLQVSAGDHFTCGIDDQGALECWGKGLHGELGNGGGGANLIERRFVTVP